MKTLEICNEDYADDTGTLQWLKICSLPLPYSRWGARHGETNTIYRDSSSFLLICVSRTADQSLRVIRGFIWKCTETKAMRWIQIERYKRILWKMLACHFVPWHFLSLSFCLSLFISFRLGGAGDILLTFRKCQFEVCVCVCACVCIDVFVCAHECKTVRACLSVVILHGSVHKSDYQKNTAENRLLSFLFFSLYQKTFPAEW